MRTDEQANAAHDKAVRNAVNGRYQRATFAAGCFWGVEQTFRGVDGVVSTAVGYSGGTAEDPSYKQVCAGGTGHAEAVEVVYDPRQISYGELLEVFWGAHDPTQHNRQGPDVGAQYRSAIFYHDDAQRAAAEASRERLEQCLGRAVATEIAPAETFWRAEAYHQRYLAKQRGE
ncbi:MAG: peptide-methionine (S)-S-oxide reductase MsrA [Phycisphaerae bacterium]|nr:peptide-methionine (S)-S-oxide reductase MsrA [Phycisphaerae bacterium]